MPFLYPMAGRIAASGREWKKVAATAIAKTALSAASLATIAGKRSSAAATRPARTVAAKPVAGTTSNRNAVRRSRTLH